MPFTSVDLDQAIANSGGGPQPPEGLARVLLKLQGLDATGRYAGLLASIRNANNEANLRAAIFEATFAHQFEAAGLAMAHEVPQLPAMGTIDFRRTNPAGEAIYFELHLRQQDQATADAIGAQLRSTGAYQVHQGNAEQQAEIQRLQSCIISKVQNANGNPRKFAPPVQGCLNLVVVSISDLFLNAPDSFDCMLASYGDPAVPLAFRNGIFGLFQDLPAGAPMQIQALEQRFSHCRHTLHGIVFAFRVEGDGVLDFELEQVTVWNRHLMVLGQEQAALAEISQALPGRAA